MRSNALAPVLSDSEVATMLMATSRTFALAIPLLDAPLSRQVGLAYLLFRIADELEDAPLWQRDHRAAALTSFASWLDASDASDATTEWQRLIIATPPTKHAGCIDLLSRADDVLSSIQAMGPDVTRTVLAHTRRTALGMRDFVRRQDDRGNIALESEDALRAYCYVVAGIVGELLTDLFALTDPHVATRRDALDADARAFGEGLQLVNILKDATSDAGEGRVYLPRNIPRAAIVELARTDLSRATRYVAALTDAKASHGMISFCDLPVRLAVATLDALDRGAPKLAREDVLRIFSTITSH